MLFDLIADLFVYVGLPACLIYGVKETIDHWKGQPAHPTKETKSKSKSKSKAKAEVKIKKISLDSTGLYDVYLRGEHHGKTPEERLDTANVKLVERLDAIKEAKKRQLNWVIAGYGFGALMSFYSWGGYSGDGLVVAMFMNIAAYHYGKLMFQPDAEVHNFNLKVAKWKREGSPSH